jgi:hypothetical protein
MVDGDGRGGRSDTPRFGFTWGRTGDVVWLRDPDGEYKRINPELRDVLRALARGDRDVASLPPATAELVAQLESEGYLVPGEPVVEATDPADISLWPRLGAFALAVGLLGVVIGANWTAAVSFPTDPMVNLWVLPFFAGAAVVHEFGHYAAAKPYFDPRIRLGLLNGVFPALVTETTDAWRCPRNVRLWISLAGPFVDVLLTLAVAVVYVTVLPDTSLLASILLVQSLRIAFVFNPLLDGDGYWLLVDAVGVPNIRSRGFRDLRSLSSTWYAGYAVCSLAFTAAALAVGLYVVFTLFGPV